MLKNKKALLTLAIAMIGIFTQFLMNDCHAGHDDITLNFSEECQDWAKDYILGKIPMTRTFIHEELPFDTQYRTKIYKLVEKHLGKRITIKVRSQEEAKQNDMYQDSATSVDTKKSIKPEGSSFCVIINGDSIIQSTDRATILNAVMEQVEALKTNPQNVIVVDTSYPTT